MLLAEKIAENLGKFGTRIKLAHRIVTVESEAEALRATLAQAVKLLCPWCQLKVPLDSNGNHVGPIPERRVRNDRQTVDCRADFILRVLQ